MAANTQNFPLETSPRAPETLTIYQTDKSCQVSHHCVRPLLSSRLEYKQRNIVTPWAVSWLRESIGRTLGCRFELCPLQLHVCCCSLRNNMPCPLQNSRHMRKLVSGSETFGNISRLKCQTFHTLIHQKLHLLKN